MKYYCAKPSAQLPKHMHILHCCYKLADNHPTLFQLHINRAVKAMGIIHAALLLNRARVHV